MKKRTIALLAGCLAVSSLVGVVPAIAESLKFNMSYMYGGNAANYVKEVEKTNGSLQMVSPAYFSLNPDGSLLLNKIDPAFVSAMHGQHVKVVPFLSNDWDRTIGRAALQNREVLATQIADAVAANQLDGIDVDIENMTETDRASYTEFVKLLRAKLPAGKEISVAVGPVSGGTPSTGWLASYDYKELAAVSDYLMVMAYDESYEGYPTPRPVASLPFVEKSVQYALTQVPPEKIVLGIPFYGRMWLSGNSAFDGMGVANETVEKLLEKYKGQAALDPVTMSAKATFTIGPQDPQATVNYRVLPPGDYTVWYENDQSIKAKLALVSKYNLKGTGSWSLMQAAPDTWNYYSAWLNSLYFSDSQGHWAQDAIVKASNKGWMVGVSAAQFGPELPLTRAQAAAIMLRVVTADASNSTSSSPAGAVAAQPFTDVPANHWAAKEIAAAQQLGLIEGVEEGRFAPDESVSREQICALLTRALKITPPALTKPPFSDVHPEDWSYTAIAAAADRHLVDGFEDGRFLPKATLTRAQMAALISRLP